jgi:hypothetical protein
MTDFTDWLIPAVLGLWFTTFGALKLYGVCAGIVGGHDKPLAQQLCGT